MRLHAAPRTRARLLPVLRRGDVKRSVGHLSAIRGRSAQHAQQAAAGAGVAQHCRRQPHARHRLRRLRAGGVDASENKRVRVSHALTPTQKTSHDMALSHAHLRQIHAHEVHELAHQLRRGAGVQRRGGRGGRQRAEPCRIQLRLRQPTHGHEARQRWRQRLRAAQAAAPGADAAGACRRRLRWPEANTHSLLRTCHQAPSLRGDASIAPALRAPHAGRVCACAAALGREAAGELRRRARKFCREKFWRARRQRPRIMWGRSKSLHLPPARHAPSSDEPCLTACKR
jgi:hypothetical protein